jgi:hypothetical protein
MSTATKGHIYYIFKVNGADDVYKLGITNDIERRWKQHGLTKVELVEAYCLGAGKAYKTEQNILRRFSANRLTKSGEYVRLDDKTLHSLMNELSKKEATYSVKNSSNNAELLYDPALARVKATPGGPIDTVIKSFMISCMLLTGLSIIIQLTNTQPAQQVQVK